MKVLLADDDPIPRRMVESLLRRRGYEVVVAGNGAEAWQILQAEDSPKLAILDWLMPEMDGVEVCRRVRERTNIPYVYILVLTGKDRTEDLIEAMEAGADDYLTKPFHPHELQARLRAGRRVLELESALRASLGELEQARKREGDIGSRIQQTLLLGQPPRDLPAMRVAALTIPSQQIDGDFYDFFTHNDHCLDVVVGDVMGKGIPAALLSAAIKTHFLRALSHLLFVSEQGKLPEPEDIVAAVHADVTGQFIGLEFFATLCYARFDLERRQITFVDCGHTKTIHYRQKTGECETLQGENMPLGVSEKETYQQVSRPFEPGDVFFFYSDGVTETRNESGRLFGVGRLKDIVQVYNDLDPEALIGRVRREVVAFSEEETFADDLTCVAVRIEGTADTGSLPTQSALRTPRLSPRMRGEEGGAPSAIHNSSSTVSPLVHAELAVSSDLAELAPIRAFVRGFCQGIEAGRRATRQGRIEPPAGQVESPLLDEDGVIQLELAVNEAASNIMRHAHRGRAGENIQIEADAFGDRIAVRLYYQGEAFDPGTVQPPVFDGSREGGFGVYIITQSVDEVHYSRDPLGRNCIALVKSRKEGERHGVEC